jgi:hypothetical protein
MHIIHIWCQGRAGNDGVMWDHLVANNDKVLVGDNFRVGADNDDKALVGRNDVGADDVYVEANEDEVFAGGGDFDVGAADDDDKVLVGGNNVRADNAYVGADGRGSLF